eukprot:2210044-Rhodomonas_salina.1
MPPERTQHPRWLFRNVWDFKVQNACYRATSICTFWANTSALQSMECSLHQLRDKFGEGEEREMREMFQKVQEEGQQIVSRKESGIESFQPIRFLVADDDLDETERTLILKVSVSTNMRALCDAQF